MSRKRSERLKAVLRVAELKEQSAAKILADCQAQVAGAQQQQQQLREYQQEYRQQWLHEEPGTPKTAGQLRNFQGFYQNLERAVELQGQQIDASQKQLERAQAHWRQHYAYQQNMQRLQEDARAVEGREQEKKLQGELDDRPVKSVW